MMEIRTKVEGTPESVQAGADWLRSGFRGAAAGAAAGIGNAGSAAASSWAGEAAAAFQRKLAEQQGFADQLVDGIDTVVEGFERYGDALRTTQRTIEQVRNRAAAEGLELTAEAILGPGPMPDVPEKLEAGASAAARAAYRAAVDELEEYRRKVKAFIASREDVGRAIEQLTSAFQELVSTGARIVGLVDNARKLIDTLGLDIDQSTLDTFDKYFGKVANVVKPVDYAVTAGELAYDVWWKGESNSAGVIRMTSEEAAFWLELASNTPGLEKAFDKIGLGDYDWDDLDDDAVQGYRKYVPEEVRDAVDTPGEYMHRYVRGYVDAELELARRMAEQAEDGTREIIGDGLGLIDGAQEKVEDARDTFDTVREYGEEKAEDLGEKVDDVREFVDDHKPTLPIM